MIVAIEDAPLELFTSSAQTLGYETVVVLGAA
jgi:hypothetical protein